MFIKQLTALMFSCITHIRGIFPEYAFEDKTLDDRKVKLLKGHYECKNAYLMTRWLKSAFKALDSQYVIIYVLTIFFGGSFSNVFVPNHFEIILSYRCRH